MSKHVLSCLLFVGLALPVHLVSAQDASVTGRITDAETGESLPGANVLIEELQRGAAADAEGNFEISNVDPGTYTFVARFVGYTTHRQEITIGEEDVSLNIQLRSDRLGLEEILVTGTGVGVQRRELGISVESVTGEELQLAPARTVDAALQGKVAGAQITQPSGQPGRSANILLRGINTLGSTQPMILIDGVQINTDENRFGDADFQNVSSRLADIDFADVERIEVVKGAAASTIYGAQGANGVIQIFTRSGQPGVTRVNFTSTVGQDFFTGRIHQARFHHYSTDAEGRITGMSQNPETGVWTVQDLPLPHRDLVNNKPYVEPTFDGVDAVFREATSMRHTLQVTGGDQRLTYLLSGAVQLQEGIERNTQNDRYSFRLNLGSQLLDNLRLDARTNFINSQNMGTISGGWITSPLSNALFNRPFIDMETTDFAGRPTATLIEADNSVNPLFQWWARSPDAETMRSISNVNANYQPFSFLQVDYRIGVDHYRYDYRDVQRNFEDITWARLTPAEGYVDELQDRSTTYNSLLSGFFRFNLEDRVGFPLSSTTHLAFDYRREDFQRVEAYGQGLPPFPTARSLAWTATPTLDEFQSTFVTFGYLLNQRLTFGELAGTSFGGRFDYSSAFGAGETPAFFPRADAYLNFSELGAWNRFRNSIPEFRIRAAYGEAGIQPGPFARIEVLTQGNIGEHGVLRSPLLIRNPDLQVEKSSELELGTDLNFRLGTTLLSSLRLSYTWWDRVTDDVIWDIDVAPSTGARQFQTNAIGISSRGHDLSLSGLIYADRQFSWLSTLNFGQAVSRVDHIAGGQDLVIQNDYILREGERLGVHFGFQSIKSLDEVHRQTGEPLLDPALVDQGLFAIVDGHAVDLMTRAVQFRPYQDIIGDPTPDFTLGFRNEFTLGGTFSLAFQWDWVQGVDLYNRTRQWMYRDRLHADWDNPVTLPGWDVEGDQPTGEMETGAFVPYYQSLYKTNDKNEFFVEDGSFLRLRELSVGYDLATLFNTRHIQGFRLSITGRNLLTFTRYSGFDPEVSHFGTDSTVRGLDEFTYPNFRNISVQTSITF